MGLSRGFLIGSALAICFAAAGLHTADAQEGSCHGGFPERFLGHCFRVNKRSFEKKDWLSARRDCESIFSESHILTDMTQEIHDALGTQFSDIDSFWLGLNDRGTEGDFYWGNPENTPLGTPVQWDPNSSNTDSKDCVAMTRSSGYKWVPTDCSTRLAFICAQDVNECTANPCHEFADCTNTDGSYTCTCRDGYMGNGKNCTGRCGQPCGENGECRNTGTIYECVCNDGFEGDGLNCTDHDECNDADHGEDHCHSEHGVCINSVGSFDCICKPGYMRTDGGLDKCVDVDECQSDKFVLPCPGHGSCENTVGGYKCNCEAGHRFVNRTVGCVDIDECAENSHTCPADSTCVNTDGAHDCSCEQEGFVVQGSTCVDLDECQQTPSPCHANADCTNTPGSYTCACRDGFQGDGKTCNDINECTRTPSPCHNLATCVNNAGSFQCNCPAGFQGDGVTSCADENECLAIPSRCPANTDCTNTAGSFSCQCKTGFTGSPDNCIDTDECAASPSPCRAPSSCRNRPGTYACVCSSGYRYQDSGEACADIDECSASPGPCHEQATCQNTAGSYTCTCNSGYSGDGTQCTIVEDDKDCVIDANGVRTCTCKTGFTGDGVTCSDVDECAQTPTPCHLQATCTNTLGSYTCRCNSPYQGNGVQCTTDPNADCVSDSNGRTTCTCKTGFIGNGITCTDLDECTQTPYPCHQQATCTNTLGSYTCRCNSPYQGNGVQCTNDPNTNCVTDANGVTTCTCKPGFTGNGFTCSDVNECAQTPTPCHQHATCTNTPGSYTCRCNTPYKGTGVRCTNDPNTNCVTNANGVTTCTCKPGFSGDGYTCSDINECANSPQACAANAQCTNTVGSYTCTCTPPYKGDGTAACIDASNANCVTNSAGEEVCSCKPGFTGIGFTCSDINECAETPRRCHQQAACTNTPGSFRCACNQGYQGDGIICRSSASVACTGSNLSKQRYQIVLDNVTLTQGLQDRTSVEYRTKIAEIESLLEPIIRRTKHGGKFQSVVVQELKIVQDEVVAVYDVCLENVNTVHGLDIQNEIREANSVSNALGVNLQTVCFVDSNNAAECPTSQEVRQGGQSGLSSATALALGIALAALCLLLLIAICCWTRRHSKSYGENQSVGSAPSVYASTYHPPPSLYRTREHLYPTPSGPTVWPTVTSESIPSTFPPGSSYY
ncbi:uncharacterized protein LOC144928343 [Branchiostoma floridae x Branchiostoma belcheri]